MSVNLIESRTPHTTCCQVAPQRVYRHRGAGPSGSTHHGRLVSDYASHGCTSSRAPGGGGVPAGGTLRGLSPPSNPEVVSSSLSSLPSSARQMYPSHVHHHQQAKRQVLGGASHHLVHANALPHGSPPLQPQPQPPPPQQQTQQQTQQKQQHLPHDSFTANSGYFVKLPPGYQAGGGGGGGRSPPDAGAGGPSPVAGGGRYRDP
ncbi:unnamed protein product, partial [Discosporangium mesarthrocarpum]